MHILTRHHAPRRVPTFLHRHSTRRRLYPSTIVFARVHLDKKLLQARDAAKRLTSVSPVHSDRVILSPNQAIGTVASAQANFMRVIVSSSEGDSGGVGGGFGVELLCVVRAVLKKIGRKVVVGDRVLVGAIDWTDRRGMIEDVYERSSEVLDPPIANVDHFLVVFSMERPKVEPFLLTRFLVEAESAEIPVSLALNKCELVHKEAIVEWKSKLRGWGYEPIFCSVESNHRLDTLAFALRDRTTVIVGPSGVGKSSLINALRRKDDPNVSDEKNPILGSKWFEEQKVGQVSARSGRGKHTTRNVSLLPMTEGGYLADTPGFNQPSLLKVTTRSLPFAFPEIRKMLEENEPARCSFKNCQHLGEPGCLVRGDWERYPYYLQLFDEIKTREEFQLRTVGTKREADMRIKAGYKGTVQVEPRLQQKKHRRQSRKSANQSVLDELDDLDDDDLWDT